jgi:hypothetical protein
LRRGLTDYLTEFAFRSATLDDLVRCWSRASGQELAGWAEQWLRAEGTPTIRLDDGAVIQDLPRRQRIGIGLYDLDGDGTLRRRSLLQAELDAERTLVAGLTAADAVVLNDQDLAHTQTGFDEGSRRLLASAACQVGDPLTEAVCWNGFWLLVTNGELPASQFTDMACRRLQADGLPESGVEALLGRAVEAADAWAPPAQRAGLREQLAAATRTAAGDARKLATGFWRGEPRDVPGHAAGSGGKGSRLGRCPVPRPAGQDRGGVRRRHLGAGSGEPDGRLPRPVFHRGPPRARRQEALAEGTAEPPAVSCDAHIRHNQ